MGDFISHVRALPQCIGGQTERHSSAEAVTALRSLPDPAVQEANLLLMDLVANVGYSYSLNRPSAAHKQARIGVEATSRTWFHPYCTCTAFLQA